MSAQQNQERVAAIAFILDRLENYGASNSNREFAREVVAGLAEGRHVARAHAGEYDDELSWRVQRIMKTHAPMPPLVRRPNLRSVR